MFVFNDGPRGPERLQYLERRPAGAKRRILDRNRRAKGNHQPIAGYVMDVRALNLDDTFNDLRKTLNKAKRRLLAESLGERGKANHIREENDDLPALRFQATTPVRAVLRISRARDIPYRDYVIRSSSSTCEMGGGYDALNSKTGLGLPEVSSNDI